MGRGQEVQAFAEDELAVDRRMLCPAATTAALFRGTRGTASPDNIEESVSRISTISGIPPLSSASVSLLLPEHM